MLAMAADEIRARAARATSEPGQEKAAKVSAPTLDDVQFRAVDPSASNEAVFVLTAKATVDAASRNKLQYYVLVVAREDIYGDLHKAFARTTDTRHLDLTPRYEFIDAVDADGDGYGELLFRKVYDSGKAYDVYRVIGNQLWPLFEGKPQ
jgi:hypothetical protein